MLPVLNRSSVSTRVCATTPKSYGISWVRLKTVSANPRLPSPAGRSATLAEISSPSPCRKSVSTLVCACWNASTSPPTYVAAIRDVHIGWPRPARASSARCHMSLTGLPMACETFAASSAPSKNSRRPNEPPPSTTWTVTWSGVRPSSVAIVSCAVIGDFRPAQTVACPSRTSAIAELVSRAELLRK